MREDFSDTDMPWWSTLQQVKYCKGFLFYSSEQNVCFEAASDIYYSYLNNDFRYIFQFNVPM